MSTIAIKRKKGESFEAMFRRFSRRVQSSGKMLTIRARRFHEKKLSKNKMHESALRRINMGAKREYLLRSGKLKEEDLRRKSKR